MLFTVLFVLGFFFFVSSHYDFTSACSWLQVRPTRLLFLFVVVGVSSGIHYEPRRAKHFLEWRSGRRTVRRSPAPHLCDVTKGALNTNPSFPPSHGLRFPQPSHVTPPLLHVSGYTHVCIYSRRLTRLLLHLRTLQVHCGISPGDWQGGVFFLRDAVLVVSLCSGD